MKPDPAWLEDWRLEENPAREDRVGRELLTIFTKFWEAASLDQKSDKTKRRYSGALHSLGGYLVEKSVFDDENVHMTAAQLLDEYVDQDEGPLICQDNETWQNEIDMVCRKLHKFRTRNC